MKQSIGFFLLLLVTRSFAGGADGTGGDTVRHPYAAWFLKDSGKKIEFCVEADKSFGMTAEEGAKSLEEAARTWQNFLTERSIDWVVTALTRKKDLKCDGSEDLALYLGTDDTIVRAAKMKYTSPVALAEKLKYDGATGWGKGLLWVASPGTRLDSDLTVAAWTHDSLTPILLHEFGHTLGNAHIDGTIMEDTVPRAIVEINANNYAVSTIWKDMLAIESGKFLGAGWDPFSMSVEGVMGDTPSAWDMARKTFRYFTGKNIKNEVPSADLKMEFKSGRLHSATIRLKSKSMTKDIQLEDLWSYATFSLDTNVFLASRDREVDELVFEQGQPPKIVKAKVFETQARPVKGEIYHGVARAANGKKVVVVLEVNSEYRGTAVRYMHNGMANLLFTAAQRGYQ